MTLTTPPASVTLPDGVVVSGPVSGATLTGTSGADAINAGIDVDKADHVATVTGGVTVNGGAGNDTITGTRYGDHLNAGAGDDHIFGGAGNDTIQAGIGADVLGGGAGNDTFKFAAHDMRVGVAQTIVDFGGANEWNPTDNDFIVFSGFGKGSTLTFVADSSTDTPTRHFAYYDLHDSATGHDYTLAINSTDGQHLGIHDYNFY